MLFPLGLSAYVDIALCSIPGTTGAVPGTTGAVPGTTGLIPGITGTGIYLGNLRRSMLDIGRFGRRVFNPTNPLAKANVQRPGIPQVDDDLPSSKVSNDSYGVVLR